MKRTYLGLLAAGVLALGPAAASAQLLGPVYPPPAGVTFSASGSSISGAGQTRTYSNLNPAAYDALFWGFTQIDQPWVDGDGNAGFNGPTPNMFHQGFWGPGIGFFAGGNVFGQSVYLSYQFQQTGTPAGGPTFNPLQVILPSANPANAPNPAGGPPIFGTPSAIDATGMNDFQVWLRYSVGCPQMHCTAVRDYYDNVPNKQPQWVLRTSNAGAFMYDLYTPPPPPPAVVTPEPVTMTLLGTGLAAIGAARRRRAKAKTNEA